MLKEEAFVDFYGPLCWGALKAEVSHGEQLMWMNIVEEFDGSVAPTWPSCDSRVEETQTWAEWEDRDVRTQLGSVMAPKCTKLEADVHSGEWQSARGHHQRSVAFKGGSRQGEGREKREGLGGVEAEGRCGD